MQYNHNVRVCAVIVTFNRKALLLRTLTALYQQTRLPDFVIIVDNASTDGTADLLKESGYLDKSNLHYLQLPTNIGGAGGFYEGVKYGYEQGFDWLWLMDDDGYPSENCLQELLNYKDQFDFYGPLVLDDKEKIKLSFPITLPKKNQIIRDKYDLVDPLENNIIENILTPFNGVLIRRRLIEKMGFPDARFFIWGDEIEYTMRSRKIGARIATIADVLFFHPTADDLGTPMFFNKMKFNNTNSMLKLYCLCRNNTFNLRKYHGNIHALLFFIKVIWFYTFTKPSWQKLLFSIRALWHGWQGDFTHHNVFIGKTFEH